MYFSGARLWHLSPPCVQLKDLQDKYSECEDMLHEAREDIKNLRNKSLPNSTVQRYTALASVLPMDSLAAEIEGTFRKGLDTPPSSEYKWVADLVCKPAHQDASLPLKKENKKKRNDLKVFRCHSQVSLCNFRHMRFHAVEPGINSSVDHEDCTGSCYIPGKKTVHIAGPVWKVNSDVLDGLVATTKPSTVVMSKERLLKVTEYYSLINIYLFMF